MSTRNPANPDPAAEDFEELPPEPATPPPGRAPEQPLAGLASSAPTEPAQTGAEPPPIEPKIYGETRIDRVSSMMLAIIFATAFFVGWLYLRLITERAYGGNVEPRVEIVEVVGGTGGSPDVDPNARAEINVAGGEAAKFASNNMEDASEFEEPQVELTNQMVIDAFVDAPSETTEVDMAEALPNAGPVASGRRSSKIGNSPIGYGFGGGPGDGGVAREQRWVIVYAEGQTPDEYARQLDFFKIELGVPFGTSSIEYASNFAGSATRRTGLAKSDTRLFFIWQGQGRKGIDLKLLQRAGIEVGNRPIFQFYPADVEDALSQLEVRFAGRQPAQIRSTRFQAVAAGRGYEFKVISQEPLR